MNQETLMAMAAYDTVTGIFTSRISRRGVSVGMKMGSRSSSLGYIYIALNHKKYLAHRLAWLYVYGAWPLNEIDHINGDRSDNRIENLRLATSTQNKHNRVVRHDSKSQMKFIHKLPSGRYRVCIRRGYSNIYDRVHSTIEEAKTAAAEASRLIHGEFSRC